MNKEDLFDLYGKVQKGDKNAEEVLIEEHKRVYPRHVFHTMHKTEVHDYKQMLHTMYLHLYK